MAPKVLALFRFDEPDDSIAPSDETGSVGDLATTGDVPPVVNALTGFGRSFQGTYGMQGLDSGGGSLTQRDCTIQALVAAPYGGTDRGTIVARGTGENTDEYVAYALELYTADGDSSARAFGVRWWWQDTAGNTKLQVGADFIAPPTIAFPSDAQYFLVTATRRWVSATRVELAYYVGGQLIGEFVSADGDIGGAATVTTFSVGSFFDGVAGFETNQLAGVVDELRITNYVMSGEEIAATWDRIATHQPRGYRAMRDLMQPGAPISDDPSSRFQKLYRLGGHVLGYAMAQIENARLNLLPDRAYGATLEQWERILRESPKLLDSIRQRRDRLVAHLRQRAGVSVPGVRATLANLLQLAKSQIQVLSYSATIQDSMLPSGPLPSLWWFRDTGQWSRPGTSILTNFLGTDDVRHDVSTTGLHAALLALESQRGATFQGGRGAGTTIPAGAELGTVAYDLAGGNYLFFAVENSAGSYRLVYQQYIGNAAVSAKVVVAVIGNVPLWFRYRFSSDGTKVTLEYSTTSATAGFATAVANLDLLGAKFGWIGYHCRSTNAALGGLVIEGFVDTRLRVPKGTRAFFWYVFRDPALPGSPDIGGATAALRRLKHAHTKAAVITNKQLLFDDPSSGFDLGPMGGY